MHDVQECFYQKDFCIWDLGCLFSGGVLLGGGGGLLSELYSITHSVNYVSAGCCRGPLSEHRKPDWLCPLQEGCWKEDQNFCWKLLGKTTPQSGIVSSFKEYWVMGLSFHQIVCVAPRISIPTPKEGHWKLRGGGVQKQGKYEAKLEFPEGWGGGGDFKSKHLPW